MESLNVARKGNTVRRITANLRDRDSKNLDKIAQTQGLNPNDAIRQALATQAFLQDALKKGGAILVREADGAIREVQFVG
ncbi:hypothetical protein [Dermatophilus congolensis]|uniref:Uncharacterized protein n=1 Tax=Dermatophilus congolensis TaxID=1863 RepID=A0A239VNM6_9MICO|nr:hypothetical protein [Dermatophilus congolensis]MBO3129473.1 hypothetical protein [Dermatophilus congolensis]MBO3131894.1 hypothetical protein [Dermatophilus congolensis]MBO3133949.1 hypothetical protein [Dermatophilus congolensis]MBO3136180.1 hypothetical protein [Dermatophilus congolensis]MBO3138424.1 hypothetical protein [Dermatophilus congolensis]